MRSLVSKVETELQEREEDKATSETTSSSNCSEKATGTEKLERVRGQAHSYVEK